MANPRIVRALEVIHQVKLNLERDGFMISPALLNEAENELLYLVAELKNFERDFQVPS